MKIKENLQADYEKYKEINSTDGYSKGVVDFGEAWANLMETKISEGAKLEEIASTTSHEANTDGITGFMYGCAVKALAHFWEHGEALRVWHNKEYRVPATEKGIVNPAILTIQVKP